MIDADDRKQLRFIACKGTQYFVHSLLTALALSLVTGAAEAQTIYHLHKEPSSLSTAWQLKTNGPDVSAVAIQSVDLKNYYPNTVVTVRNFEVVSRETTWEGLC